MEMVYAPGEARATGKVVVVPRGSAAGDGNPGPAGVAFGANVRVWNDTREQSRPSLVVHPATGDLYVAFQHHNASDWDIYLSRSSDRGTTWSDPAAIANTTANETNPSLAVTSTGAFALVYEQDADPDLLVYFQSTDGVTWRQGTWSLGTAKPWLSNATFPRVAAQDPVVSYPDGIMIITQVRCAHPTNCVGGSDTAYWLGSQSWSAWPPAFNLGNFYWGNPGGVPPQFRHPALAWSSRFHQVLERETEDNVRWNLEIVSAPEGGGGGTWYWYPSSANSTAAIYPRVATTGAHVIAAASFVNATLFPLNPTNHNILFFRSANTGLAYADGVPLDPSVTDQRSVSVAGSGTNWSITYYSDAVMTQAYSEDSGAAFAGPQAISDNAGTAVNDELSTSVAMDAWNYPVAAWQDDRDGDVNVYVAAALRPNNPPGPPRMTAARLTGPVFENVTLDWVLSGDDGAGENDIAGYEVWNASTYNAFAAGYALLASVPAGTTTWTHAGAGLGDPDAHFYQVRAIEAGTGRYGNATRQAAKYARPVSAGMNLLSVPLEQADDSLSTVLQTIGPSVVSVRTFDAADASDPWKAYATAKGYGEITALPFPSAFWANVTANGAYVVAGLVTERPAIPLLPGWNLVGHAAFVSEAAGASLAGLNVTRIEAFQPGPDPYALRVVPPSELLVPGEAYWVFVAGPGGVWDQG